MGYTTEFDGSFAVDPPLNEAERTFLRKFSGTRRMDCEQGPYYVERGGFAGQDHDDPKIRNYNRSPEGQPGLWCQWVPSEDGTRIEWDGGEKFYDYRGWLQYLIDHFLKPDAHAKGQPGFEQFTFDHVVNGIVNAEGEDGEKSQVVVCDNDVRGGQEELDHAAAFRKEMTALYG